MSTARGLYERFYRSNAWTEWHGPLGVVSERTTVYPPEVPAGGYIEYTYTLEHPQPDMEYTVILTPIYGVGLVATINEISTTQVKLYLSNTLSNAQTVGLQIAIIRTAR